MEHIGKILANSSREPTTPNNQIPDDVEPTLEDKRENLRKSLGVSSLDNTFENFKPVKGTEKALAAFKALAYGKTKRCMLLCYGGVGNGKTHLCEATAIALCKKGIRCGVLTMAGMMRGLKNAIQYDKHGNEGKPWLPYNDLLAKFCNQSYLIIDDVGMGGSGSDWEWGQLEDIMIVRYREGLFTILTTNLDIEQDKRYPNIPFVPERIVSRFSDPDVGTAVLNKGSDYRREGKRNESR